MVLTLATLIKLYKFLKLVNREEKPGFCEKLPISVYLDKFVLKECCVTNQNKRREIKMVCGRCHQGNIESV